MSHSAVPSLFMPAQGAEGVVYFQASNGDVTNTLAFDKESIPYGSVNYLANPDSSGLFSARAECKAGMLNPDACLTKANLSSTPFAPNNSFQKNYLDSLLHLPHAPGLSALEKRLMTRGSPIGISMHSRGPLLPPSP